MYLIIDQNQQSHYQHTIDETDLEMADEGLTAIINIDTSEQYDDGEWKAIEVYQPNTETVVAKPNEQPMIMKHTIKIPENHTAEIQTVDNNVVIEFKPVKPPIDYDRIKTGSIVRIKYSGQCIGDFDQIKADEPVYVVFWETPHFIRGDYVFVRNGLYSSQCTFMQDGKFVAFASDTKIDFIAEVIEY